VAEDSGVLVFVEVRTLKESAGHTPEETIQWKKQQRLSRTALAYTQHKGLEDRPARFDVVAVTFAGNRSTRGPFISLRPPLETLKTSPSGACGP
jgi:putative endonuclease